MVRNGLAIIGIVALFFAGCGEKKSSPKEDTVRTFPVRVVAVERGDLLESVAATGTLAWERQVKIRAQAAGVVHELGAREGDNVTGGDILTRIIAPEMKARLEQIDAELRRAEAERAYVCANHETDRRLGDAGALEAARVDNSRKGCTTATDGVRGIEARRAEVRTGLAKLIEKAPDSGIVLEWSVEPGEFVAPGQPLAILGTGKRLVVLLVPETDMQRGVAVGTQALIRLGDVFLKSQVSFISPLAKGPARAVRVEIPWPEEHEAPTAGASVYVSLVMRSATAHAIVPEEALFLRDGGHWVTAVQDGKSRLVRVEPTVWSAGRVALEPSFTAEKVVVSRPSAVPDATELFVVEAL